MEILIEETKQITVATLAGSIDAMTASELDERLRNEVSKGHYHILLDLRGVDFMSSAGLYVILAILKLAQQHGGDLRLAGAQEGVNRMLDISGFTSIIQCYSSVEDALEASWDAFA